MPLLAEFEKRINRTHDRAQAIAQGATLNADAWREVAADMEVLQRLLDEGAKFVSGTSRRADVAKYNAGQIKDLSIEQAEDSASTKLIGDNIDLFGQGDVGTVKDWLNRVRADVFATAWAGLTEERRAELAPDGVRGA